MKFGNILYVNLYKLKRLILRDRPTTNPENLKVERDTIHFIGRDL